MHKKVSSSFFQRPATRAGWWAAGLAIAAILLTVLNVVVILPLAEQVPWFSFKHLVIYGFIMLTCGVAAGIFGLVALIRRGERSWLVWFSLLPFLFSLAGLVINFIGLVMLQPTEADDQPSVIKAIPTPVPNLQRIPVIYDDDGSPDGTSALLYLLSDPRVDVLAVNVSYGEAHPAVYIQHLGWFLESHGYGDLPLGAGQDAPLAGDNSFPDGVRESSDGFWGYASVNADQSYPVQDSAGLFVSAIRGSPQPVTIFVSGSLTNLAMALRLDPDMRANIAAVYIMGGAVYVPGNQSDFFPDPENTLAEWNIFVDPQAASEVFASGLDLYLVPLDATNQVNITREDTAQWRAGGSLPDFAADIYDGLMSAWGAEEVPIWDLMTAEIMLNPEHCAFTPLHLEVVTQAGNTQGQTALGSGAPNVNVCLEPDAGLIRGTLISVFSNRR